MGAKHPVLLFLPLSMLCWFPGGFTLLETDGGWRTSRHAALSEDGSCTVERRDSTLTFAQFIQQYAFSRPVILQGLTDNTEFQAQCTKDQLLARFGEHLVRLSTANTYSYHKVDLPFQDYVDHLLEPQDLASLGSETLYFFGDNNFTEWGSLFQKYNPPPFQLPGTMGAYSFGIGGSGSGVPFHWHGPGFSEVIFGRKHWFLYPPEKTPQFHPNKTTLSWFLDTYPSLLPWEKPVECTIRPGEAGSCSTACQHVLPFAPMYRLGFQAEFTYHAKPPLVQPWFSKHCTVAWVHVATFGINQGSVSTTSACSSY
ncbi:jmjC domain-containing protein 8 isoform 2-T2 [Liasis olivaceus]